MANMSDRRLLLWLLLIMISFQGCRSGAIAIPLPTLLTSTENRRMFQPAAVLGRIPNALELTIKSSLEAFLQTAGVMFPGGLIWKIGMLKSSGMKPWLMEGGK